MKSRKTGTSCFARRPRVGLTLVELLGVMVVLAILAAIAIGGVTSSQNRARVTKATVALDGYKDAFTNVCVGRPGISADRAKAWVDEASYTSEDGLKKVVQGMNELLDDELQFYWDINSKCYRSVGTDPWGGYYILTEYPTSADGIFNYFDPTAGGRGFMGLSIWCTGPDEGILTDKVVSENSMGIALSFVAGLVDYKYQGVDDATSLTGWTVRVQ